MLTPMMNKTMCLIFVYISSYSIMHIYFNYVVHVLEVSYLQCNRKCIFNGTNGLICKCACHFKRCICSCDVLWFICSSLNSYAWNSVDVNVFVVGYV
jgi:hypothetical protein